MHRELICQPSFNREHSYFTKRGNKRSNPIYLFRQNKRYTTQISLLMYDQMVINHKSTITRHQKKGFFKANVKSKKYVPNSDRSLIVTHSEWTP